MPLHRAAGAQGKRVTQWGFLRRAARALRRCWGADSASETRGARRTAAGTPLRPGPGEDRQELGHSFDGGRQ